MKKILVLGSVNSSLEVVRQAKKMGYYTVVVSNAPGEASAVADEFVQIDLKYKEALVDYIRENSIDGIITGPSEFLTKTMIDICEATGLRCYVSSEQWNQCANKELYKNNCRKHNVPCIPEFAPEKPETFQYPVVVKPIDGCSSKGITVCNTLEEFATAKEKALKYSSAGKYLVEKYIDSKAYGCSVWYLANRGEVKLSLMSDKYKVDSEKAMISALTIIPSKQLQYYQQNINDNVIDMFKDIQVENGSFFMESLPDADLYFHDMGLRMSGGMIYKVIEPILGINDLQMMIRYAAEGEFATNEEFSKIDPSLKGHYACSFCVPLSVGTISTISGLEEISKMPCMSSIVQYYYEGDSISEDKIGTLLQHFGRFKFITNSYDEISSIITTIQNTLKVEDSNGKSLIYKKFDINRIK